MPYMIWVHHSLYDGVHSLPKIVQAADKLQVRKNEIRGCWIHWLRFKETLNFDRVTPENVATLPVKLQVTPAMIDALVELPGFGEAMIEIGWLELTPVGFVVSSAGARKAFADRQAEKAQRRQQDEANRLANQERAATKALEPKAEAPVAEKPAAKERPQGTTLTSIRRERATSAAK